MKYRSALSVLFLILLGGNPAFCADFQRRVDADMNGYYETAFKEMETLVEYENSDVQMFFTVRVIYESAAHGNSDAQMLLAWMFRRRDQADVNEIENGGPQYDKESAKWFRLAAKQGVASAQFNLGLMYLYGRGVPQDFKEAVMWHQMAAEQGHSLYQVTLGRMYERGIGVPHDHKEAVKWYRLAAEQGDADAQAYLGLMYGYGKGVKTDKVYAHMWWNIAASAEIEDAKKNRDLVEKNMNLAEIEKAQGLARECTKRNYKGCRSLVYEFEDDWIRERPGLPSRYKSRNFERGRWVHHLSTISDFSGFPASKRSSCTRH